MVGLSDIPCVGIALNKISEATVEAAYRGLRYMFCYKGLVNDLDFEIKKINIQEGRVLTKVDEEEKNGKILEDHVSEWKKEVKGIKEDSKLFSDTYKSRASWRPNIQCVPNIPNPFSRFRIGREAVKKAERLAELTESGKELLANEIAHLPPVDNLPKTDGVFQNFASRKDAYDKLWESLVSEGSPQIHGIYGMPGVGKTRIAEQIWEEAKTKGKFDKVTRAVVSSQKLNVIKLQQDLAGHLNCTFASKDNVDSRASQLKQSIMKGGKVLVILDDVWREIPLNVIGIPFGDDTTSSEGACKILLTSREENVLRGNNCIDPVKITALTDDEAWDMFKESVGTGDIPDESLARKVCDKCAGLPLVIRAVGKALMKFMSRDLWNDALERLENCEIKSVPGITSEVYACLKLSFDMLVEDAKLCLLLCSLYPEDAEIPINMLINLATGSQLVRGGGIRVRAMVALLKSSSLVLENEDDKDFKLHDIIRDVARSIAVKDHAFSFIRCDSELPDSSGTQKLLCLQMDKSDFYIPDNLMYKDIHTFWVESAGFASQFQVLEVVSKFVNLRLLVLRNVCGEQQKQNIPLQHLDKLIMTVLQECDIGAIDFNLFPENIETLCIWDCILPEALNIVNLKHLRKLEILEKYGEPVVLVANTISSLSSCLEELHIPYGYSYHKAEEHNDDEVNYNNNSISQQLAEFTNLRRLKSLNMSFGEEEHNDNDDISVPEVISNLCEFHISVGADDPETLLKISASYPSLKRKSIHLCGKRFEAATFQSLIERAQVVILTSTNVDVSSVFNTNNTAAAAAAAAFADLELLEIDGSDTMEHLAKISHHHHLYQIHPRTSFFKLTRLRVGNCSAMKYIFCNSVAKCLVQLEELRVNDCPVMEAIVMNEGSSNSDGQEEEDIIIINFPKLKSLRLSYMPKLKSFNIEKKKKKKKKKDIMQHTASTMSLSDNSVIIPAFTLFPQEIAFPALEALWLSSLSISDIWGKHHFNDNASSFSKLKSLQVSSCTKLETVIPLAMLHKLQNLEELRVDDCEMMTEIIGAAVGEQKISTGDGIIFPKLRTLHLLQLKNLTSFRRNQSGEANNICKVVFPNLVECSIQFCHEEIKLEDIEIGRDGSTCCQLKSLEIRCHKEIQLPSTWQLGLDNLEYLTLDNCWWHEQHIIPSFSRLRELQVTKSGRSTLFPFSVISSLQHLWLIEISNCALLEGIVEEDVRSGNIEASSSRDKKKKKIIKLCQLEYVTLKGLPNLRSFMSGADYECHMPALEYVKIDNCGLSALFTCSSSTNLQRLWWLKVSNCRFLEHIVRDDDDDISKTDDKIIITLSHLWLISLANLPNLKSFGHTSSYDFDVPKLEQFTLFQCPQVDNFSSLKTSTGRSIKVYSDWNWRGVEVRDLNDYIKENRKREDSNLISDEGVAGETSR